MKVLFSIVIVFVFSQAIRANEEPRILKKISKSMQVDMVRADSLLQQYRNISNRFTEDGKLEFALYYLVYHITNNRDDSIRFNLFLEEMNFQKVDFQLLEKLHETLLNEGSQNVAVMADAQFQKDATRRSINSVLVGNELTQINEVYSKFSEALKHARKSSVDILPSIVFQIITEKLIAMREYKKAVRYYQKAIDYSEENDFKLCEAQFCLSMAKLQLEMRNLEKARLFFERSTVLAREIKNNRYLAMSLRGIGDIHLINRDYQKGINSFQNALLVYYQVASDLGIAQTHKDIGKSYLLKGDKDLAERNFKLSKTYYDRLVKGREGEDDLYENFSKMRLEQGKAQEALGLINRTIDLRKKNSSNMIELFETYEIRSSIYAALGHGKKAYQDLYTYSNFKDSLYSANLQKQIAELSELYESEKKSKQIIEQEQRLEEERNERILREQQLENTKLRNRQIILIFSLSLLFIISILLVVYFRNKQSQLKRRQTETELRQQLLRSQMNPHFVFNAMSVIQSYIYDNDTEKSSQFLVSLSRLMRLILENSSKETIKLTTELEILERFLFIQQERFENRFSFEIKALSDVDPEQVRIPPMVLQPFLENATEHGELDKVVNGKIRISYKIEDQLLIFVVEDNGIGRKAAQSKNRSSRANKHKSMAISITEKRIELMRLKYSRQGYIKIEDLDKEKETGTKITIAMPLIDE